ncbi:helix-turn-helix domain-containing protein, partial [Corynebacterium sp.]|uniref:helix-turn-helix domain-containing protein n=1 Tax=Corynebacterium sp. TaxID=1720 RepID=UPI0026DD9B9A
MSLQAMLWALDGAGPIPAPQKLVLIALADFVNDENGSCWPSQEVIAQRATMSARTVRRHISWLEDEGLLEVKRRWRGARQTSNLYRLNIGVRWDGPASKPTPEDKPPGQPMADNMTAMETPTTVGYPQSAGQVMEDNLSAMERPAETPERTGVQAAGGGLEIPMADTGDRHMADTGDRHMADTGVLRSPNRSLIEIPHPSLHPSEAGERAGGEAAASPREGAPDGARDGDWTPEQNPQTGTGQRSASGVAASPRAGAPDGVVALKVVPEPTAAPAPDRRERPQGDSGAMNHIDEISGPGVPGRPRETPSGPNPRHSGAAVTPADRELLEKVLPEPMRAIPPRDVPRVAGAVRERLAAG